MKRINIKLPADEFQKLNDSLNPIIRFDDKELSDKGVQNIVVPISASTDEILFTYEH